MASAAAVAQHSRHGKKPREVICPSCGERRTVTYRTALRIQQGVLSGVCAGCPGPLVIEVTEEHRRYWLTSFGVPDTVLAQTTASAYVSAHGVPAELSALAASAYGIR